MEENEVMEDGQLFAEEVPDGPEEAEASAEEESGETAEPQPEAENREDLPPKEPEPERFTFEAGGQTLSMTMAELQSAAARVRQADQIIREQNRMRASPEMQLVARLAAKSGMSTAQYVQAVEAQMQRQEVERMKEAGLPESYAKRLLELEQKERAREQAEERAAKKADTDRDFMEFVKAYPDVREFPAEVIEAIKGGEKPLSAYRAYENRQLKAQLAALRQNEENRKKTPGSLSGEGPAPDADAFLSGFGPA